MGLIASLKLDSLTTNTYMGLVYLGVVTLLSYLSFKGKVLALPTLNFLFQLILLYGLVHEAFALVYIKEYQNFWFWIVILLALALILFAVYGLVTRKMVSFISNPPSKLRFYLEFGFKLNADYERMKLS
mmetsp:Transcript_22271/g.40358  ORF Transcript_22271/g.40358 Transcript_22271/m.40358 type:complete len:129 (-) Transcript_22271:51-437(-)